MDGKTLKYRLQLLLDEETGANFIDERTAYDFLNEAAIEVVRQTNSLTKTQSITTVADQAAYSLDADFLSLYLKDKSNKYFIRYSDGTTTYNLPDADYSDIIFDNRSNSVLIPDRFAITPDPTLDSQVAGTETAGGAVSATSGEATLTDIAGDFSDVSAGDSVHNTTDNSSGVVLEKTSSTVLITALFPDDPSATVDKDWDISDAYVIQPQGRYQIVLDPAPSAAGHTLTIYMLQKPAPVYGNWRSFRFPSHLNNAVVKYAAWLFKYKDREPNFGDKWFILAENEMRKSKHMIDRALNRHKIRVNMKARK